MKTLSYHFYLKNTNPRRTASHITEKNQRPSTGTPQSEFSIARLLFCFMFLISFSEMAFSQTCQIANDFSSSISITVEPDATTPAGTWYRDRYWPDGFVSQASDPMGGTNRLKVSISASDGASSRPSAFQSAFYNTQGRSYDVPAATTTLSIDLFIPSAWAGTNKRMAGLWGTARDGSNAVSGFPFIEFTSDGGNPRFRGYNADNVTYLDLGLPTGFAYDSWILLEISTLPSGEFQYTAGDKQVTTTNFAANSSVGFGNVILQGHNYDPLLPIDATNPGVTYDIYWDNLIFNPGKVKNLNTGEIFCTIQSAIDDADTEAGDVIQVADGTYNEQVNVSKSVILRGSNAGTAGNGTRVPESIVNGEGSHSCFLITANNVTIDGFKVTGADGTYGAAILGTPTVNGFTIQNNVVTDNVIGVYPTSNGASWVKNNLFDSNNRPGAAGGSGIYVELTNKLTVEGNEFKNHLNNAPLIFAATTVNVHPDLVITKNYIHDNTLSSQIYLNGVSGGTVSYNTVTGGATGVKVAGGNADISIVNNLLDGNQTAVRVTPDPNLGGNTGVQIHDNSLVGTNNSIDNQDAAAVNATCNWYGSNVPSTIAVEVSGTVTYIPYTNVNTDNNGVALGFMPLPGTCTGPVHNLTQNTYFATIQAAIDDPSTVDLDVIEASNGTYPEIVNIYKSVTLQGESEAGVIISAPTAGSGIGVTINATGVILQKLTVQNYQYGIRIDAAGTDDQILNVTTKNNSLTGINVPGTTGDISRLLVDNVTATGNSIGFEVYATAAGSKVFDQVTIQNSTFSNNARKGIYIERANTLLIDNVIIDKSGIDETYVNNNNGIDINLKYAAYSGITITNSDITNSGKASTVSGLPEGPSAIAIKARDDAPSYNGTPASLTGVTIKNNVISGPENGIRIGEYSPKINTGPSNVTIENNDLSFGFANKAVINRTNSDVTLICNYHGADTDYSPVVSRLSADAGSGKILVQSVATSTEYSTCISPTSLALNVSSNPICAGTPFTLTLSGLQATTATSVSYQIDGGATQVYTANSDGSGELTVVTPDLPAGSYTLSIVAIEALSIEVTVDLEQTGTVNPDVVAGTASGASSVYVGSSTAAFTATGNNAAGTWSSSNTSLATVDPVTGVVRGVASGSPNIIFTVSGCGGPQTAQQSITVLAALPVTLIKFEATKQEKTTLLTWVTASEINSQNFYVQHSRNGKDWAIIGNVDAKGESNTLFKYAFVHLSPNEGENLYRLKMIDRAADRRDETFSYSHIVSVRFGNGPTTHIYPNPVSDYLFINVSDRENINNLRVVNLNGQKVIELNGKNIANGLNIEKLESGIYLLEITRSDGSQESKKFAIAR